MRNDKLLQPKDQICTEEKENKFNMEFSKDRQEIFNLMNMSEPASTTMERLKKWKKTQQKIDVILDRMVTRGIIKEKTLTNEESKKLKLPRIIKTISPTTKDELLDLLSPINHSEQSLTLEYLIEATSDVILDMPISEEVKGENLIIQKAVYEEKKQKLEFAMNKAYKLGQDDFVNMHRKILIAKPPGANSEDNKPTRLKYGGMYHYRIAVRY
ncbi:MAG: hypothetical protein WC637_14330, partial [Victivallales bacterium]